MAVSDEAPLDLADVCLLDAGSRAELLLRQATRPQRDEVGSE